MIPQWKLTTNIAPKQGYVRHTGGIEWNLGQQSDYLILNYIDYNNQIQTEIFNKISFLIRTNTVFFNITDASNETNNAKYIITSIDKSLFPIIKIGIKFIDSKYFQISSPDALLNIEFYTN